MAQQIQITTNNSERFSWKPILLLVPVHSWFSKVQKEDKAWQFLRAFWLSFYYLNFQLLAIGKHNIIQLVEITYGYLHKILNSFFKRFQAGTFKRAVGFIQDYIRLPTPRFLCTLVKKNNTLKHILKQNKNSKKVTHISKPHFLLCQWILIFINLKSPVKFANSRWLS